MYETETACALVPAGPIGPGSYRVHGWAMFLPGERTFSAPLRIRAE